MELSSLPFTSFSWNEFFHVSRHVCPGMFVLACLKTVDVLEALHECSAALDLAQVASKKQVSGFRFQVYRCNRKSRGG